MVKTQYSWLLEVFCSMSLQFSNVNGKKKVELLCNMLLVKFNYLTSFFSMLKCYRITQKIVAEEQGRNETYIWVGLLPEKKKKKKHLKLLNNLIVFPRIFHFHPNFYHENFLYSSPDPYFLLFVRQFCLFLNSFWNCAPLWRSIFMTSHKELNIFLLPCYRGKKCFFYLCWFMYSTKIFFLEPLSFIDSLTSLLEPWRILL